VIFGQNLVTLQGQGGMLRVGQVFEPEWNF
jgi:hypothetical protein